MDKAKAKTECTTCFRQFNVSRNILGRTATCPECKCKFVVAEYVDERVHPVDSVSQNIGQDSETDRDNRMSTQTIVLIAGSVVVGYLILVAILAVTRVDKPTETEVAANPPVVNFESPELERAARGSSEADKWYSGGISPKGNGYNWMAATDQEKLATCADIAVGVWKQKMLALPIKKNTFMTGDEFMEQFRECATSLKFVLDYQYGDGGMSRELRISKLALAEMASMDYIKGMGPKALGLQ